MKMHWVSFAEAEKKIAGLIGGGLLKRLEHNRVLNDSLLDGIRKRGQRSRERALLMWMIANGVITSYWITRDGIPPYGNTPDELSRHGIKPDEVTSDRWEFYRIPVPNDAKASHRFWVLWANLVNEDGDEVVIQDNQLYQLSVKRQDLDILLDVLSPSPTLHCFWQLAHDWAGEPIPPGYDLILLQIDKPPSMSVRVQDRLRRLQSDLGAEEYVGKIPLCRWETYQAFQAHAREQWPWLVPASWEDKKGAGVSGNKDGETIGTKDACPDPGNRLTIPKEIERENDALVVVRRAILALQEETEKDPTAPEVVAYLFGGRDMTGVVKKIGKGNWNQDKVEKVILTNGKELTREKITRCFHRLMEFTDSSN